MNRIPEVNVMGKTNDEDKKSGGKVRGKVPYKYCDSVT